MRSFLLLYAILLGLLLFSCYNGHGLDPDSGGENRSGISGTITFTGAWPDSTREVRVVVLDEYPAGLSDPDLIMSFVINHLMASSDTIPRYSREFDYELPLAAGLYGWVVVAWFPDITDYFLGVKELGAYYINEDDAFPAPVNVIPESITPDINITADLANVYREEPFFKRREGE